MLLAILNSCAATPNSAREPGTITFPYNQGTPTRKRSQFLKYICLGKFPDWVTVHSM